MKKLILILFISLGVFSCRKKNIKCSTPAKLVYYGNIGDCNYLIITPDTLSKYYIPKNINDYSNFLTYTDTQLVNIDYQILNEFSQCNGIDMIELFCLTDR